MQTHGGVLLVGGRVVKSPSTMQGRVALSTAQAETCAIVQAFREGSGARQLLHDAGWERISAEIRSDASTVCSAIARKGIAAMKHVETRNVQIREPLEVFATITREWDVVDVFTPSVTASAFMRAGARQSLRLVVWAGFSRYLGPRGVEHERM